MFEQIQEWIKNPKRDYREGLGYFKQFATKQSKNSFQTYLEGVEDDEKIEQFDPRFTLLVNQVVFIEQRMKANPDAFAEAAKAETPKKVVKQEDDKVIDPPKQITLDELPAEFCAERERLKDLIPLMAKIHAEMAAEKADDKRLALVTELVKFDDERRAIWERINAGTPENVVIESPEDNEVINQNMLKLGMELTKKVKNLKEKITRNEDSHKKHIDGGKQKDADKALERITAYKAELATLEAIVGDSDE